MTVREAAEYLKLSVSHTKHLISKKKIKAKKEKTTTNKWGYVWDVNKESVKEFKKNPPPRKKYTHKA